MTKSTNLFCKTAPGVQRAWDKTGLNAFMQCPYKHHIANHLGWGKENRDNLEFGIRMGKVLEFYANFMINYPRAKLDHALNVVVKFAHEVTFGWESEDNALTPWTLIRAAIWYIDRHHKKVFKYLEAEMAFKFPIPLLTPDGEPYAICGFFDFMVQYGDTIAIKENKTTKSALSGYYWKRFNPGLDVEIYNLAGRAGVGGYEPTMFIMEALQTGVTFSREEVVHIERNFDQTREFKDELVFWIKLAEECGRDNYWPRNVASCVGKAGVCDFINLCQLSPKTRDMLFANEKEFTFKKTRFVRRKPWNPLDRRD